MGMNLLSVKEVATLLQTSGVQVRRMIRSGELAPLRSDVNIIFRSQPYGNLYGQRFPNNRKEDVLRHSLSLYI